MILYLFIGPGLIDSLMHLSSLSLLAKKPLIHFFCLCYNRMETVVHIHGTESTDYESPSGRTSLYQRQQSPLSTILSKSPPTSTESLSYNSSGVDSPLNQSTSDLTTASYTPSCKANVLCRLVSVQSLPPSLNPPPSPMREREMFFPSFHDNVPTKLSTTLSDPPAQRYNPMLSTTPINMERMDSTASSVGSASQYYRSPSILSPLSRSDSTGSSNGMDKVKRIQDKITVLEIVSQVLFIFTKKKKKAFNLKHLYTESRERTEE